VLLLYIVEFVRKVGHLSISRAACSNIGLRLSMVCPLSISLAMNFPRICWKSEWLFCSQYWRSSPVIKPFRQLGGCAECGGI